MNILVICNSAFGLAIFRSMLLKTLIQKGNNICVILPSVLNNEKTAEAELEKIGCKLHHIPMERRGMNPVKDIKLFFNYLRTLIKQRPDYVITYTIKPNIYGGIASRLLKIPYVANITGLGTAFLHKGLLRRMVISMYKVALKNANVIFFENIENCNTMVDFGIVKQNKSCVLPGAGVDLERFRYKEYPEETGEISFIFIGRVMREKGIEELFLSMQRLKKDGKNCVLNVVGGFEEDYEERLKQYEQEGWLYYHGYQCDVRPFIEKSHCLVLPSWHEGMSNTNLECAAMGRPLITSNINGCLEAVIDSRSGLLCQSRNADSLYHTMKKFIELPYTEKKQMGIEGRKHMEQTFDKRKVVAETIKAFLK